jgi:hypothetical protein
MAGNGAQILIAAIKAVELILTFSVTKFNSRNLAEDGITIKCSKLSLKEKALLQSRVIFSFFGDSNFDKIYRSVTMVYNYQNSGHYPSSCLLFKTRLFGHWILSLSSGGI